MIRPARRMCEMFYPDDLPTGAKRWGEFAAHRELHGIYKVLLKIGSPNTMIAVAGTTWKTFYSEGTFVPVMNKKGHAVLRTKDAPIQDIVWGHHSTGWLETALALAGGKDASVTVIQDTGDFEFTITWR